LSAADERLISDNFLFIIATPKLDEVNLEKALQIAPHIAIWLVRKNQIHVFKSQWIEEHKSGRCRTMQASPEIQPDPPEAGDFLGDEALFDDDSINTEDETSASIEPSDSDANNSSLVVYQEAERCGI
jgi:hypothetical protein